MAHTPTCAHTQVRTHSHTCTTACTHSHMHTHVHSDMRAHTCTLTHAHIRTGAHTHVCTLVHTHICARTYTHRHAHTRFQAPPRGPWAPRRDFLKWGVTPHQAANRTRYDLPWIYKWSHAWKTQYIVKQCKKYVVGPEKRVRL